MSACSTLLQLAAKAGLVLGALFVVSVLLAAMPGHRAPVVQSGAPQESASPSQSVAHSSMQRGPVAPAQQSRHAAARQVPHRVHHHTN